jgi:hypothetical protein
VIKLFDFLFSIPKWFGFVGVILFGLTYHAGSLIFGYSITVSWLWILLIVGGLVAGLRLSLAMAALIVAYSFFAIPGEPSRVIQVGIASALVAVLVGGYSHYSHHLLEQARAAWIEAELQRDIVMGIEQAAQTLEDANGNIAKVKRARTDLQAVMYNFPFPDNVRTQLSGIVQDLSNLELATAGWRGLHKIIEDVKSAKLEISARTRRPMKALGRPGE